MWRYPLRYYTELRDFYLSTLQPLPELPADTRTSEDGVVDIDFDLNAEMFRGDSL